MADETLRPSAAGDLTQLTPTSGYANWDCVNDITPDNDTTKVTSPSTVGLFRDLYKMPLHSGTGTIYAVELWFRMGGNGKILIKPNTGGSVYEGDKKTNNGMFYDYYCIWEKNPHTDAQWTWGDIDILQIGCELETTGSKGSTTTSKSTQVYVNVITSPYLPILTTDAATDIDSFEAKEHGTLQCKGGFGVTVDKRGFELWRFPSSVNDPSSTWTYEEQMLIHNNHNIFSAATAGSYGNWLELYLDKARPVTGFAYGEGGYNDALAKIYVEFYYNNQWNFAFEHTSVPGVKNGKWHFEVGMTEHTITGARIKIASDPGWSGSATLVDGCLFLCADSSWEESGDFDVESFEHVVSDLNPERWHGVRAMAHNSVGWNWGWQWSQGITRYDPTFFETLAPPALGRSHGYIIANPPQRRHRNVTET